MNKQISIIGCGWLGLPLGEKMIKSHYQVKGSTTSPDKTELLKNTGIEPYVISISEEGIEGPIQEFLKGSQTLIINIPPRLRKHPDTNFVAQMDLLGRAIEQSDVRKVLFISSTSVYKEAAEIPIITEKSSLNGESPAAQQLIAAEQIFQNNTHFKTTILRFGGLIGPDRHPAKFLSGKKDIKNPEAPINLIHQKDCIAIIKAIIKNQHWNMTFNAVAPRHPSKKKYYTSLCKAEQLPLPQFDYDTPSIGKIVSSEKVEQLLNYKFQHKL